MELTEWLGGLISQDNNAIFFTDENNIVRDIGIEGIKLFDI